VLGLGGEVGAGVDGVDAADETDGLTDTAAEAAGDCEQDAIGVGWWFAADVAGTPVPPPWTSPPPPPTAAELATLGALWPSRADETVERS
jgi:hypothetical protein